MKYDKYIYRPPKEYNSILLQVTSGCTHNRCKFCGMYRYTQFKIENISQIEKDIIEASKSRYYRGVKRVFLLNGNAFVLSTEKLLKIAELIHKHLPQVEVIASYASIKDISLKTDTELKKLKENGYNDLYLGIESGNEEALKFIDKPNTAEEAVKQMQRLDKLGYNYYAMILLGLMGKGVDVAKENGKLTGKMLSKVSPRAIFPMTLTIVPNTPLYTMRQKGEFKEASEYDKILELYEIIYNLECKKTVLVSMYHNSNILQLKGILPNDKMMMLNQISNSLNILKNYTDEELDNIINRDNLTL